MVSILLADDHHVVRQGLRALLSAESDFHVVGETGDGLEVVPLVERLRPDVLVLDVMMPGVNGLEVLRQIQQRSGRTAIVVLSMHGDEAYVAEALRRGATAYVLKDATATDLSHAVREAIAGRRYLSPVLSEKSVLRTIQAQAEVDDPYKLLTTREREILQLTAEGLSSTQIAVRLSISPRTAETHRANLMRKLGLQSQSDVIRYAIKRGIVPIE